MTRPGNYRRGDRHPRAWPQAEVELALELYRGGMPAAVVARKLELPERTVRAWCSGERRG